MCTSPAQPPSSTPSTARPRGVTTNRRHGFHGARRRAWTRVMREGDRARCLVFFLSSSSSRAREDDARAMRATDRSRGVHPFERARAFERAGDARGVRARVRAERLTMKTRRILFSVFVADERFRKGTRARTNDPNCARSGFPGCDRGRSDVDRSGRSTGRAERASETSFGGRYRCEMDDRVCVSRGRAMREDDATDDGWAPKRRSPMDNRFPPSPAPR